MLRHPIIVATVFLYFYLLVPFGTIPKRIRTCFDVHIKQNQIFYLGLEKSKALIIQSAVSCKDGN